MKGHMFRRLCLGIATVACLSLSRVVPAHACDEGDQAVRVIAPFDLYGVGAIGGTPLGHFNSGDACIDNNLNRGVSPPQGWTWIYFKSGLRDFKGIASLSAFQK